MGPYQRTPKEVARVTRYSGLGVRSVGPVGDFLDVTNFKVTPTTPCFFQKKKTGPFRPSLIHETSVYLSEKNEWLIFFMVFDVSKYIPAPWIAMGKDSITDFPKKKT